jgi:hypothetical protein
MELRDLLTAHETEKLRRFGTGAGLLVLVLAVFVFWAGVDFLKENVFKHYFNPTRHMIVEQDPDTGEIYMWKDAVGNVYTPDDPHVKYFPYGVTLLILLLMGVSMAAHNLLLEHYAMLLLLKRVGTSVLAEDRELGARPL